MFFIFYKKRLTIVMGLMLFLFFYCFKGYSLEKPLLAVLDLYYEGIPKRDAILFTDIITMNIFETDRVHLISRLERTKLLKAHGFPLAESKIKEYYPEIASLLYADYLVGGIIKNEKEHCTMTLHLYENRLQQVVKILEKTYPSPVQAMNEMREYIKDFFSDISLTTSSPDLSQKVMTSLSPVPIKEKILFIFNKNHDDTEWAAIKKLFYILITLLSEHPVYQPFYMEIMNNVKPLTPGDYQIIGQSRNCHSVAVCTEQEEKFIFIIYNTDGEEKLVIPLSPDFIPETKADEILLRLNNLPPLSQDLLITDINKNLYLEEKIEELLYLDKISSKRHTIRIYHKTIKSHFTPNLNPNLNLLSIESDFYWYYLNYLGSGIGYGFNLGYPGTIDSSLNNHPLIYQHEFRLIPLSLRTASTVSIVLNNILALSFHNMYTLLNHVETNTYTYTDAGLTLFLKFGLNMGLLIHQSENFAIFLDIITLYYTLPIIPHPQYDTIRHFSGDLLGAGISFSF